VTSGSALTGAMRSWTMGYSLLSELRHSTERT